MTEKQEISFFNEVLAYELINFLFKEKEFKSLFEKHSNSSKILKNNHYLFKDDELYKKVYAKMKSFENKIQYVFYNESQYPDKLADLNYFLPLFYYQGNLNLTSQKCLSIIGSRNCSKKGLLRTKKLAIELAKQGFTIVSGLAKGVDTIALKAAIHKGGNVIAVIGTPLNDYYPPENKDLQNYIGKKHLLISQVPFVKYQDISYKMKRTYFPKRNAIMSALSQATIIVEAGENSGSLIQAKAALKQGRKLFILNSCFENKTLSWPAFYQKKGAIRVKTIKDIIDHLS